MRREARKRTCRSENFFSSSRVRLVRGLVSVLGGISGGEGEGGRRGYRCWTLWKPGRRGTGTKTTIAFLPWPTSSCWGWRRGVSFVLLAASLRNWGKRPRFVILWFHRLKGDERRAYRRCSTASVSYNKSCRLGSSRETVLEKKKSAHLAGRNEL